MNCRALHDMDHPVRTLLYEVFILPPLRLLQRVLDASERIVNCLSDLVTRYKTSRAPRTARVKAK